MTIVLLTFYFYFLQRHLYEAFLKSEIVLSAFDGSPLAALTVIFIMVFALFSFFLGCVLLFYIHM
jgi:hypothetical protein